MTDFDCVPNRHFIFDTLYTSFVDYKLSMFSLGAKSLTTNGESSFQTPEQGLIEMCKLQIYTGTTQYSIEGVSSVTVPSRLGSLHEAGEWYWAGSCRLFPRTLFAWNSPGHLVSGWLHCCKSTHPPELTVVLQHPEHQISVANDA